VPYSVISRAWCAICSYYGDLLSLPGNMYAVCVSVCVFWGGGRYNGGLISVGAHNVGSSTPLSHPTPPPLNPPLPALNVRKSRQLNSDAAVGILPCFG
jgi:hypothetical protein